MSPSGRTIMVIWGSDGGVTMDMLWLGSMAPVPTRLRIFTMRWSREGASWSSICLAPRHNDEFPKLNAACRGYGRRRDSARTGKSRQGGGCGRALPMCRRVCT